MEKIEVRNLYKVFGPAPETARELLRKGATKTDIMETTGNSVGVDNVSFHAKEGEILVIMGLSGSGKSTLVRCLNRLIDPTAGEIYINGENITRLPRKALRAFRQRHMGMVFQNFALLPHRNVWRNVAFGLELKGIDDASRREKAMAALAQVGLKGWENAMPAQLSGGMQQRVGLARALALDADIMLMDEAFSALDPLIRRDMQDELLELQERLKKTIVFISHDLDEALKIGNRIILMKDGAIVQQGTPEEILTQPADDYVARFVADVDITRTLTAKSIMVHPESEAYLNSDGPHTALRKMRKSGSSSLFVTTNGRPVGLLTAEAASDALLNPRCALANIMDPQIRKVSEETPVTDLYALLADYRYPLAVVDGKDRLQGIIVRGTVLGVLAEMNAQSPSATERATATHLKVVGRAAA